MLTKAASRKMAPARTSRQLEQGRAARALGEEIRQHAGGARAVDDGHGRHGRAQDQPDSDAPASASSSGGISV